MGDFKDFCEPLVSEKLWEQELWILWKLPRNFVDSFIDHPVCENIRHRAVFSLAEDKNCNVITIYNLQYLQQQTTAVTWAGPGRHLHQTKVTELPHSHSQIRTFII